MSGERSEALRKQWERLLGPMNAKCEEEKLKEATGKALHDARVWLGRQRACVRDLPSLEVVRVEVGCRNILIFTSDGRYIRLTAEDDYGELSLISDNFMTVEDARKHDFLPDEFVQGITDAEDALAKHTNEATQAAKVKAAAEFLEGLGHKVEIQ